MRINGRHRSRGIACLSLLALSVRGFGAAPSHDPAHHAEAPTLDPKAAEFVTVHKADEWDAGGITILTQAA
jgi:hypothetical protein